MAEQIAIMTSKNALAKKVKVPFKDVNALRKWIIDLAPEEKKTALFYFEGFLIGAMEDPKHAKAFVRL